MNQDWKKTLEALKGDLPQPLEEEKILIEEGEYSDKSPQKETLRVLIDKKGRKGKTATIIEGFTVEFDIIEEVARKLKQQLGVGGSCRENEILIQGEHKQQVTNILKSMNYRVK